MAPEGAMSVHGGNWQIFDKMVQKSGATVLLNTSVSSVSLADKQSGSSAPKYVLTTRSATAGSTTDEVTNPVAFDNIIIATPFQFSNITADGDVLQHSIDPIPYVRLHVTLFSSPFRLSPGFFGLPPASRVPSTVLTTLANGDNATSGVNGAGKAGFFSLSTLRLITNPKTLKNEYLYKIFSPEKLTSEFLSKLLGVDVPESITSSGDDHEAGAAKSQTETVPPISWYFPHVFYSYPQALPRVTFQDPILGPGLFYTSGIESFISTMETSALMGMNVARLLVDDFQGLTTTGGELFPAERKPDLGEDRPVVKQAAGGGRTTRYSTLPIVDEL